MKRLNKKGFGINELTALGIIFVTVAILLTFGARILQDMQTTQDTETGAKTQERFVANQAAYVALSSHPIIEGSEIVRNRTLGGTGSHLNRTTDYQMDYPGGRILCNSTDLCAPGATDMNITYTYSYYTAAYNVSGAGLESLAVFGEWLPTLALIVVASVIIGIIIVFLMKRFD